MSAGRSRYLMPYQHDVVEILARVLKHTSEEPLVVRLLCIDMPRHKRHMRRVLRDQESR